MVQWEGAKSEEATRVRPYERICYFLREESDGSDIFTLVKPSI